MFPEWQSTLKSCRPKNKYKSRKFLMQHQMFSSFLVCDGLCLQCWLRSCCVEFHHLWFTSCHCCPPATLSLSDCITLPLINSYGGPSRWTPSTWVSWSFFGQPGWSSCWDRATLSAFYFGHLYSPLRSESFHYHLFKLLSLLAYAVILQQSSTSIFSFFSDRLYHMSAFLSPCFSSSMP